MKNLLLTGLICALAFSLNAQVSEIQKSFSQGHKPAFSMTIKDVSAKTVENAWTKYIKGYKGKVKKDRKSGEIFADNALLPAMSTNTVDVYAHTTEMGADVEIVAWFDLGGAYANVLGNSDAAGAANELMEGFNVVVMKILANENVDLQEDVMKKMEGDMKNLVKKKLSLEDAIAKAEKVIAESKAAIEQNVLEQATKQGEIDGQAEVVKKAKEKLAEWN